MHCLHGYIGSNERMTMQNLQIPETTESRIVPKWLFPPRFSDIDRFTSSRSYIVLVTPISAKTQKATNYCRGVGSSEWQGPTEGEWEHPSSAASRQQSHQPQTASTKDLSKPRRDIHLVEIQYCEDTRPQNRLNAAK